MFDRISDNFTRHPASVGESYWQHMGVALSFSARMAFAAFAALVHAFLPFLFEKTGSRLINQLHQRMVTHRQRQPQTPAPLSGLNTSS
jgi:hypothetical protein